MPWLIMKTPLYTIVKYEHTVVAKWDHDNIKWYFLKDNF